MFSFWLENRWQCELYSSTFAFVLAHFICNLWVLYTHSHIHSHTPCSLSRTLDSQRDTSYKYVTIGDQDHVLKSYRIVIVRVRKVLRSYEQPACCLHCALYRPLSYGSLLVLVPIYVLLGEPRSSSPEPQARSAQSSLFQFCLYFILLSICWHLRRYFPKALKSLESRSILSLFCAGCAACGQTSWPSLISLVLRVCMGYHKLLGSFA